MSETIKSQASSTSATSNDNEFTYNNACIYTFNTLFAKYKSYTKKDKQSVQLASQSYPDYVVFCDISLGFDVLTDCIKYITWHNQEKWNELCKINNINTFEEYKSLRIKLPKSQDDLIYIYNAYPWIIDEINQEMYNIITLDNYEFMQKLYKINRNFYFSTFTEDSDGDPIMECEMDTLELWVNIKCIVKRLLKHHVQMTKNGSKYDIL